MRTSCRQVYKHIPLAGSSASGGLTDDLKSVKYELYMYELVVDVDNHNDMLKVVLVHSERLESHDHLALFVFWPSLFYNGCLFTIID